MEGLRRLDDRILLHLKRKTRPLQKISVTRLKVSSTHYK